MNNNSPETDEIEIDLVKVAQLLLHRARFIIAITLLVAAAAFGITYFLITPRYTSTAMMYVNNTAASSAGSSISTNELSAAQSLVDTYIVILKSRTTLEQIIERENLPYDYEELYDMIESGSVNSTEIFSIDVTSTDPLEAERIANTITQVLPDRIASIVDGSDVRAVDHAIVPSEKSSPSFALNTVIGALAGFIVAVLIVVMRYLFDDKIHEESYLTQAYPDIPLLAVVPDMRGGGEKSDYYSSPAGRQGKSDKSRRPSTRSERRGSSGTPREN